jgi:hypothetical protein
MHVRNGNGTGREVPTVMLTIDKWVAEATCRGTELASVTASSSILLQKVKRNVHICELQRAPFTQATLITLESSAADGGEARRFPVYMDAGRSFKNSVALVRERTILTERPPHVEEVSANVCG